MNETKGTMFEDRAERYGEVESPDSEKKQLSVSLHNIRAARQDNKAWAFTKRSIVAVWVWQKKRAAAKRLAREEAKRSGQQAAFNSKFDLLSQHKHLINPISWRAIESYAKDVDHDSAALGSFASNPLIEDLVKYVQARQTFLSKDQTRQQKTQVFHISCDSFFSAVGYSTINPMLQSLVRKHQVSNADNIIAAGIFGARRNAGAVAYSMAQSARVGAYNGDVSAAFLNHITHLSYSRTGADLTELHRRYIVYAYRLLFLNKGDKAVVNRALFSLIYDNGSAVPKPPVLNSRFSQNLHPEFHNSFLPYLWTVAQAAAHLDNVRKSGDYWEKLFHEQDVSPFLRSWKDEVPKPGFHVGNAN